MSMSCALGLAVCLSFSGETFTANEAAEILDNCYLLPQLPPSEFEGLYGFGIAAGERIEDLGLDLDWSKGGGNRKASWLRTCRAFERTYNDKKNWG